MNPEIFRAYDIRGVVDVDFHPGDIERLGRAIATYAHERGYEEIVVGRDNRLSSPPLRDALVKGLVASGAHVLDIGIVTTPILYHTIHTRLPHPSGVMITGSHNPPEYNGFKICIGKAAIFGEEIARLHRMIEGGAFREAQGRVTELPGIIARYQEDLASRISLDRPLHVVVDAGNGTAGPVAPELFRRLGCTVVERYCELDGRYPNHHPDPTDPANLEDLIATVRREGADLGLAFDGDADRLGVIDETGRILWGDQ
ncbi:MAG: phosphomannomutase, partial [Deltaproteobacteria bacterium]